MEKVKKIIKKSFIGLEILFLALLAIFIVVTPEKIIKSRTAGNIISPMQQEKSNSFEVFGFAPYWTLNKLDNINFEVLTTLAYFGIPIKEDGSLDRQDVGFVKLNSQGARELFEEAHRNSTKVVLTITLMEKDTILAFLDDPEAQEKTINETVELVKERELNGINVDIEYVGNPGSTKRKQFTLFVKRITEKMHQADPNSKVTVSVLASSARYPKLYDISQLSNVSDGIFMMAYDFATTSSQKAMPTAPLYGYKEGKYWYDVATAVEDFTKKMPREKLILGLPWYAYDYPVYEPGVNAKRDQGYSYSYKAWITKYRYVWRLASYKPKSFVQTYKNGSENTVLQTGWDDFGKVSWKAYKDGETWRIYFLEDERSLTIKYDFAKQKNLGGVGIWALGFDHGREELWDLLADKFGEHQAKLARRDE